MHQEFLSGSKDHISFNLLLYLNICSGKGLHFIATPSIFYSTDYEDCNAYHDCAVMGSPVLTNCPDGTTFDGNKGSCEVNGVCITVSCLSTSGSVFLSFGPASPYYAFTTYPLLFSCAPGTWFNVVTSMCEIMMTTTTEAPTTTTTPTEITTTASTPGAGAFLCTSSSLFPGE
jgi:hypothetical protein